MKTLTFTLKWNATVDLDLRLNCHHDSHIYYSNKSCSYCDTKLDVDMRADTFN